MGTGVPVERYSTDNGKYTSKEFTRELHVKGQGTIHIGVGVRHHNGVEENTINNLVIITRTMMIHAALRWHDTS